MEKNPEIEYTRLLEEKIGYAFRDKNLCIQALTHSTYTYEHHLDVAENNERLEFLGDSVLALIIGEYLYRQPSLYKEGLMSKIRSSVVCESTLCEVAESLSLGDFLLLGKGEEQTMGRSKHSNLSNCLEALIAAVYLDGGLDEASRFIIDFFGPRIKEALRGKRFFDHKSSFLEYIQREKMQERVSFQIVKEEGPEHCRVFYVQVLLQDEVIGYGMGNTKKEAEQEAAKEAYYRLRTGEPPLQGGTCKCT